MWAEVSVPMYEKLWWRTSCNGLMFTVSLFSYGLVVYYFWEVDGAMMNGRLEQQLWLVELSHTPKEDGLDKQTIKLRK